MNHSYISRGIFILLLIFAVASSSASQNKFEKGLLKLIKKWRTGDVPSLPIAGLPLKLSNMKLDHDGDTFRAPLVLGNDTKLGWVVYKIAAVNYNYPNLQLLNDIESRTKIGFISYNIDLSEITVRGLEDMSVKRLSASESALKISIDISIPRVKVHAGRYRLQGRPAFFYKIDDTGELRAKLYNLKASADIKIGSRGVNTVVKKLNFYFSVDDIETDLSGSGSIVNSRFKSKVLDIIRGKNKLLRRLRVAIIKTINKYLQGHTPAELIEIISSI